MSLSMFLIGFLDDLRLHIKPNNRLILMILSLFILASIISFQFSGCISYTDNFVMRLGYIHDDEGEVKQPTFGAGVHFDGYGFDFGYTAGEQGHPRSNTLFFSISAEI